MAGRERGLALALGGGGARGFAHVGVIEVLHQRGVPIRGIAGTSAGAVAGAGYAMGASPAAMRQRVLAFVRSKLANHPKLRALAAREAEHEPDVMARLRETMARLVLQGQMVKSLILEDALLDASYFADVVRFFLPEADIGQARIPFVAVATDVLSGEPVVLDRGPLRPAVTASCSVPGVSPPVEVDGRWLVDGGVVSLVPVDAALARWGRPVLAVGVERDICCVEPPRSALESYLRAGEIQSCRLSRLLMGLADLALEPEVGEFHWTDFAEAERIMDLGREAAEAAWPRIAELLHGSV
jgi:NTE family protein